MQVLLKRSNMPVNYEDAYQFLNEYQQKIYKDSAPSMVWFLEHQEVITAGLSATEEDLFNQDAIPVKYTERGGKFTYHGPGQRVVYFLLDLKVLQQTQTPDVRLFVRQLENWMLDSFRDLGLEAYADVENIGIWSLYKEQKVKLASIGLRIRRWVTSHGVAINLCTDLAKFKNIVACGHRDTKVSSLSQVMEQSYSVDALDEILISNLKRVFGLEIHYV
jgi:lipoyl(octanoyl) transferase